MPANICPVVPLTFCKAQVPFLLVDVSPSHWCIDERLVLEHLKNTEVVGVLFVHTYGYANSCEEVFRQFKSARPDVLIIDDKCLCMPEVTPKDSVADLVLFSTGYAKHTDLGGGGYGFVKAELTDTASGNWDSTLEKPLLESVVSAAKARDAFKYRDSDWLRLEGGFPDWTTYSSSLCRTATGREEHRQLMNREYERFIPAEYRLEPEIYPWRYNLRVRGSDLLLAKIFEHGKFASSHYRSLASAFGGGPTPVADQLATTVVNLFNDLHMNATEAGDLAQLVFRHISDPSQKGTRGHHET